MTDRINHAYTPFYEALLHDLSPRIVVEFGIGSQVDGMPYRMLPPNVPGGSLRGWREFFPAARIIGADLDRDVLFAEDRIDTFWVDVQSTVAIRDMWQGIGGTVDLIVDDAYHTFKANECLLKNSFHMLRPGGFYIIEDIDTHGGSAMPWEAFAQQLGMMGMQTVVVAIPGENRTNNCFAAICKV